MILTFILLGLAVLALWLPSDAAAPWWCRQAWLMLLAAAALSGLVSGVVGPAGCVAGVALLVFAWVHYDQRLPGWIRVAGGWLLLALAVALMMHRVPGFANPKVIDAVRFTADARPFSLYLNFDKTLIGLAVVGLGMSRPRRFREWGGVLRVAFPAAAVLAAVLIGLSLAAGYVRWAPKVPPETGLWVAVNLAFVCLAEEALFRGFIQGELQGLLRPYRFGRPAALVVAALAFGAAHAAGGATYVALASIAGLGYGWVYQRTGRIEAPILVHGFVNTVHFLGFTYPALA